MSEQPIRLLIVDDEDSFRVPLAERLPKYLHDCQITHARNGDEALRAVKRARGEFDVALIDRVLYPPPDGIEVMRRIRALYPGIQAIVFTIWEMEDGLEALRAGAYRYIAKSSFDIEELSLLIRAAVEHRQLIRQSWLARIVETSSALQSSLDAEQILQMILRGIQGLGYDRVRLYLLSEDGKRLFGRAEVGGHKGFTSMSRPVDRDTYTRATLKAKAPCLYRRGDLGPDLWEKELEKEDVEEWVEIPLIAQGKPIGKLSIDNKLSQRKIMPDELEPLMVLANQAAAAIQNARAYEQAQQNLANLSRLYEASRSIALSLDPDKTLDAILQAAVAASQGHSASLSLLGLDGGWTLRRTAGYSDEMRAKTEVRRDGISAHVVREQRPFPIPDIERSSIPVNRGMIESGFRAAICLPLLAKDGPIGVLWVNYSAPHPFSDKEIELLQTFANQAAAAIENARLFSELKTKSERLERYERNMAAVQHASAAISSTQRLDTLLNAACQQVVELFGVDHSGLVRFDESGQKGIVVAEYPQKGAIGVHIPVTGAPMEERLISAKEGFNIFDVAAKPQLGPVKEILLGLGIQSILVVPIVFRDRVIGSFSLDAMREKRRFSDEEFALCQIMAAQLAVAIDNADLTAKQERNLVVLGTFHRNLQMLLANPEKAEDVLQAITGSLSEAFDLATCTIGFVDETGEHIDFRIYTGLPAPVRRDVRDIPPDLWAQLRERNEWVYVRVAERPDLAKQLIISGLEEFAALPLRGRDRFFGVVTMSSKSQLNLKEEDWELVQSLVGQAALALENAERYRREQERSRRWETVVNSTRRMSEQLSSSPKKLLEIIARGACEIVGADCAVIYPYYASTRNFDTENYAGHGLWNPSFPLSPKPRDLPGWAGRILAEKQVIINNVTLEASEVAGSMRFVQEEKVRAFVGLRLDAGGEPVGILYVNFRQPHRWTEDELSAIRPFVDQAALTIQYALVQDRRNRALRGIIQAGQDITSTLDWQSVLKQIVITAKDSLGADIITLHPYDQESGKFDAQYVRTHPQVTSSAEWLPRSSTTAQKILALNQPHFADNSISDETLKGDFVIDYGVVASAGLPLKVGRETVGVMFVNYRSPHHFSPEEQDVIQMFANEAALAMHNARLFDRIGRGQRRLQKVVEMSRRFSSSLRMDEVIAALLEGLGGPLPQAHCRKVQLYDRYTDQLTIHPASYKYYWSDEKAEEILRPIPTSISIGGWVVRNRQPLNVPDVSQDDRYLELIPETRSQLTVPIMFGDEVIGVLTLESRDLAAFSEEDELLLMGLADQASVAIENARRYQEIEARTALAWMGIAGATWFHSIRGSAATLKDWLLLVRQKLSDTGALASVAEDFAAMDAEVEKLLEIPTRGVLPTKSELKPVTINKVLREVGERLCQPHENVRLDLRLQGDDSLRAQADSHWLPIAMEYLIKNALQAMKQGGRLRIETREENERVRISIADTGPGIPEHLRSKLFKQPLTREEGVNGSGMGLLIVKMIVDACGGDITFESAAGKGTRFLIWLPRAPAEQQIL